MLFMFEVYCRSSKDEVREKMLTEQVAGLGGKLEFLELHGPTGEAVCLTFGFGNKETANQAAEVLRLQNEHVEGPYDY